MIPEKAALNYVIVKFLTPDRKQIIDPLKIFKTVGEMYKVNTPALSGYILSEYHGKLEGIMNENVMQVELIYKRLGKLVIQSGVDEENSVTQYFKISKQANQIQPVTLPNIQGSEDYYYLEYDGNQKQIGKRILDPNNFLPEDPTKNTHLLKLTLEQHEKLERIWRNQEPNTSIIETTNSAESLKIRQKTNEAKLVESEEVKNMELDEPITLLLEAFRKIIVVLIEFDNTEGLSRERRNQLIKRARTLLETANYLNKRMGE